MSKVFQAVCVLAFAIYCPRGSGQQLSQDPAAYRVIIDQYCVTCHNDTLRTAGLSLQQVETDDIGADTETWEKVLRKISARSMPPAGMPRPTVDVYEAFAASLEAALDAHAAANPAPGRPLVRRLNRTEYINSVIDLLGVAIVDDSILPSDDTMYGFDNIEEVLSLSPLLAEQYISAARKVRRLALSEPEMQPVFEIYTVSTELRQDQRMNEDLPFGSRGGVAIDHYFPLDGEYVMQVRLQRNSREYIRGLTKPHRIDLSLDGTLLGQFDIGGEKLGKSSGLFSTASLGDVEQETYERTADEILEVRFPAKAGTRRLAATFLHEMAIPEQPLYPEQTRYDYAQYKGGLPGVHTVAIGGPYDSRGPGETSSRDKILICGVADGYDEVCARRILERLARRAYRRTPGSGEIGELMNFYRQGSAEGFEAGIGLAIERMLAGPEFIFVIERAPAGAAPGELFRISPLELATRMSLFLWSSIPDDELLQLAESGELLDAGVLERQVRRMLDDPRSEALVDHFASQWLTLGKLNAAMPNIDLFPYFEDNLKQAFRTETELFFDYVFRNDRPLLELLDADYTFLNERLARHYGIGGVYGSHFRRVQLPDEKRGGLLGQGSILTATSYPDRTSPVIRGKWILENILGAPPPPPPANVPGLRDRNEEGRVLNMRERMEQHRANPVCASCHKVMDPLGFALENYDATGKWRTIDASAGSAIDPSGILPDGTPFSGPAGLREVLVENRRDDFVATVVEKLLTYANGRGVEYTELPVIRSIMRDTASHDHQLSAIITAIIKSTSFQMRRASQ